MKSTPQYTSLAEFILDENEVSNLSERTQLVRILSRSSTLPKVEDIFIRVLKDQPKGFLIEPGISISLGSDYLTNPLATLLILRYGLEWQIWYKNQHKKDTATKICDIAACRVAAKFYELTPNMDKGALDCIPQDLIQNIFKFKRDAPIRDLIDELDFEALSQFHKLPNTPVSLSDEEITILKHLASPVEYLLMSGGDQRLKVDPNELLNKYGCRPFPRPEAFTFASSTASSISNHAYNKVQFKRKRLIRMSFQDGFENSLAAFSQKIKSDLKTYLQIPESAAIILAPSGTDITLEIAGICQALFEAELTHILVAADETGSGVPAALTGKHFSNTSAQNQPVQKGALIEGFREVNLQKIELRNAKGQLKHPDEVDRAVYKSVKEAIAQGQRPILHVIDQSKLGYTAPSDEGLEKIQKDFGAAVLISVDNSQLRMDPADIRGYLEKGFIMTLTGSKFFTGPPFSGALLVPAVIAKKIQETQRELPEGLAPYFYKNDWPDWPIANRLNPGVSTGVYMRWYASIAEIERYYKTPLSLRFLGVEMFCEHVNNTINSAPFLEHITGFNPVTQKETDPLRMKAIKTIFPFFTKCGDRVLKKEETDRLYKLLNQDIAHQFAEAPDEIKRIASIACHIGQPVAAVYKDGTLSGVMRINLGARVISESWKDRDSSIYFKTIEEQMIQVSIIVRKIQLILEKPALLKE